ncbi:ABC transporter ATP-binding protein [Allorhizocola rhizosphaerae]|uniref:ABC transporter ATP-binding protein n=1 Tax=Allorhizocola rhizosphaerae TaxID=1872709 RepID=UPI000E3C47B8|nr:ABC transporter ATP-binding protein [Allorhizocola rhizosphaerae]
MRSHSRLAWEALRLGRQAAGGTAAATLLITLLLSVAPALAAYLTKLVIDELTGAAADPGRAVLLTGAAAAATGAAAVLGYASGFLSMRMQNEIVVHVQKRLYERVNRFLGLRYFEDPNFADRLRLAEDAAKDAPSVLGSFAMTLVRSAVTAGAFIGVLIAIWAPMAVLLLLVTAAALFAQLALARREAAVAHATTAVQRRQLLYQQLLTDLRSAKEIRLFGLGGLFQHRMIDSLRHATDTELGVQRRSSIIQSGLALLGALVAALGAMVVVHRAAAGPLTAGDFTLFVAAVAALQGAAFATISQLQVASRSTRLFANFVEVMNAPQDLVDGEGDPGPLRDAIELQDVWFRYHESGPWVLRGVTMAIPAGHAVGLVGYNGAGKSTLVKLLCRFYDPERGRITWDGKDIRSFSVAALRRRLGATFQDFQVYDLPAAENIGIGDLDRFDDREAIRRAARLCDLDDTLQSLPKGYDTLLSRVFFADEGMENGVALSGGQNQRLALARALLRDRADVLILDEPSSGLDAHAEHQLHQVLYEHSAERTCLLISHRLGAMRAADAIAVLADGVIVELGSHDELMSRDGAYAELFTLQAASYQDDRLGGDQEPVEFTISVPIGSSFPGGPA